MGRHFHLLRSVGRPTSEDDEHAMNPENKRRTRHLSEEAGDQGSLKMRVAHSDHEMIIVTSLAFCRAFFFFPHEEDHNINLCLNKSIFLYLQYSVKVLGTMVLLFYQSFNGVHEPGSFKTE